MVQLMEGTRMTITLPESMRGEVEAKAKAAGCPSVEEYVALLIASDDSPGYEPANVPVPDELVIRSREDLEAKILEGLNSGTPVPATPEFWEELNRRVEQRAARRKSAS
jgi:antitoxin ParD1/3/4